ncbi:unnamed protein product, partial [Rotaria sordida]
MDLVEVEQIPKCTHGFFITTEYDSIVERFGIFDRIAHIFNDIYGNFELNIYT